MVSFSSEVSFSQLSSHPYVTKFHKKRLKRPNICSLEHELMQLKILIWQHCIQYSQILLYFLTFPITLILLSKIVISKLYIPFQMVNGINFPKRETAFSDNSQLYTPFPQPLLLQNNVIRAVNFVQGITLADYLPL